MDEEEEHSPREVSIILNIWNLLMQKMKKASPESQEAKDDFINQQKSANTNKKTATDMNTFLRYIEANGMKNEKIESFIPASELDHFLSKFV